MYTIIVTGIFLSLTSQFANGKILNHYDRIKDSKMDANIKIRNIALLNSHMKQKREIEPSRNNTFMDYHDYYSATKIGNDSSHWINIDAQNKSQVFEILKDKHNIAQLIQPSFSFPYYGHYLDSLWVATGGFLFVGSLFYNVTSWQYIAPLMANFDINSKYNSSIKVFDNGTIMVIAWEDVVIYESPNLGQFRFECIIHLDGKITFIYKDIPVTPANINQNNHSVKVGLSDALYIWHYGHGLVDIYQYHQIAIELSFPKSNSQIVFKPLPTCVNASSCHHCFDPDIKFNCKWCAALQRCSDGIDRHRQLWLSSSCQNESISSYKGCGKPFTTTYPSQRTPHMLGLTPTVTPHYNPVPTKAYTDSSTTATGKATVIPYSTYMPGNLNITIIRFKNIANITWILSRSITYDNLNITVKYRFLNSPSNWINHEIRSSGTFGYIIINGLHPQIQYIYEIFIKRNSSLIAQRVINEEVCSNGWKWYNGSCYSYQDSHVASWEEARKHCKNFSGDLVTILNEKEMQIFGSLQIKKYAWIGLKRYNSTFRWINGIRYNFSFWETGQPISNGRNCVALNLMNEYHWVTQICSYSYSYICEASETPIDSQLSVSPEHLGLGTLVVTVIISITVFGGFVACLVYKWKCPTSACRRCYTKHLHMSNIQTDLEHITIKISRLNNEAT